MSQQGIFQIFIHSAETVEDRPCWDTGLPAKKKRPAWLLNAVGTFIQQLVAVASRFQSDKKRTIFNVCPWRLNRCWLRIGIVPKLVDGHTHRCPTVLEPTIRTGQEVSNRLVVNQDSPRMLNSNAESKGSVQLFQSSILNWITQSTAQQSDDAALGRFGCRITDIPTRPLPPALQGTFHSQ